MTETESGNADTATAAPERAVNPAGEPEQAPTRNPAGRIIAIQGSVVEIHFDAGAPPVDRMLRSRARGEVVIEVAALTGSHTMRGLVFQAQHDLSLGMAVLDTGGPITVPVGESALGRMLNLFGEPLDGGPALEAAEQRPRRPPRPTAARGRNDAGPDEGAAAAVGRRRDGPLSDRV